MLTLLLAGALMGPPAPPKAPEPYRPRPARVSNIGCKVGALTASLDLATTEIALMDGSHEANPLMRDRRVRVGSKVAGTAFTCWAERKLRRHGHHGWANATSGLWSAVNLFAAVWNVTR